MPSRLREGGGWKRETSEQQELKEGRKLFAVKEALRALRVRCCAAFATREDARAPRAGVTVGAGSGDTTAGVVSGGDSCAHLVHLLGRVDVCSRGSDGARRRPFTRFLQRHSQDIVTRKQNHNTSHK